MTSSVLRPIIQYKENKGIEVEDRDYNSSVYITTLFKDDKTPIDVAIAVGKYKFDATKKTDLVYFPIYILSNDRIKAQIGVYETTANKLATVLDEENEVVIELLGEPLLYSFATPEFIQRCKSDPEKYIERPPKAAAAEAEAKAETETEVESSSSSEDDDDDDEDFMQTKVDKSRIKSKKELFHSENEGEPVVPLPEEQEDDDIQLRAKFQPSDVNNWMQKFLRNNHYSIVQSDNNGDCLFDTIRRAFDSIGKKTTILKLRQVVSERYTDSMYRERKKIHDDILQEERNITEKINAVKDDIDGKKQKQMAVASKTREEQEIRKSKLEDYLAKQEKVLEELKDELKNLKSLKMSTIGNLSPQTMRSLEDFRRFIMTREYWADEAAIRILEEFLNIKIIPFDENAYKEKSVDNVVRTDIFVEDNPILCTGVEEEFNPDYYILTSYSGLHYNLIEYKNRGALRFHEIPYRVKILLVNKCMEKNASGFYNIQDFRNFKSLLGLSPDLGKPSEPVIPRSLDDSSQIDPITGTISRTTKVPKYSNTVAFAFNSMSATAPRPGKGLNEHINAERVVEFANLHKITNWRRKLSDEWTEAAFRLDNHMWASVEHYVLGSQFKHQNPSYYAKFSLESDAKDIKAARKLSDKPPHGIKPDVTYNEEARLRFRREALKHKFDQPDMNQLLRATKDAKLSIFKRGSDPEMDVELMRLRESTAAAL